MKTIYWCKYFCQWANAKITFQWRVINNFLKIGSSLSTFGVNGGRYKESNEWMKSKSTFLMLWCYFYTHKKPRLLYFQQTEIQTADRDILINDKNTITRIGWLGASDKLLFIFLILILVLDSSSWCTYGGFRTWGGEQGGLKSPRSRPKVLSPDNLAIFVAQLVGKTSFIPG